MLTLVESCELFLEIGFHVWADESRQAAKHESKVRQNEEARAELRGKLALCVTELQKVHEVDARMDLLKLSPPFAGRERCLERMQLLRQQVLKSVRNKEEPRGPFSNT